MKMEQNTHRVVGLKTNQPSYRILVVDDQWDTRRLMIKLLQPVGFDIQEASNGQEAIDIWKSWQPHLIWMDMRMPVMDGYQTIQEIKNCFKTQNSQFKTIIIAMTASAFEEEKVNILAMGCDDFLRKPFQEADIFNLIHKHIGAQYTYEETEKQSLETVITSKLSNLDIQSLIATLPPDLLANLEQATLEIDMEMIDSLIQETQQYNPILADELTKLAMNFNYEKILTLVQKPLQE